MAYRSGSVPERSALTPPQVSRSKEYRVWVREGGVWTEAEYTPAGSYAQLTMNSPMAMYAITQVPDERLKYAGYITLAVLAAVGAIVLIVKAVSLVKKKPKVSKTSEK